MSFEHSRVLNIKQLPFMGPGDSTTCRYDTYRTQTRSLIILTTRRVNQSSLLKRLRGNTTPVCGRRRERSRC